MFRRSLSTARPYAQVPAVGAPGGAQSGGGATCQQVMITGIDSNRRGSERSILFALWRSLLVAPLVLALSLSGPHVHAQVTTAGTQSGAQWGGAVALQPQQVSIAVMSRTCRVVLA